MADRPPPVSGREHGRPSCWCWFRLKADPTPALGLYLGEGRIRLMRGHANHGFQRELHLDVADAWAPLDEDQLEAFERQYGEGEPV